MAGLANVEVVRSVSLFGLSYVGVYFKDDVDIYFARRLVGEKLQEVKERLPQGYGEPVLGPNSSGLGQVFWYTIEDADKKLSAMDLRTLHDWTVRLILRTAPGVVWKLDLRNVTHRYSGVLADGRALVRALIYMLLLPTVAPTGIGSADHLMLVLLVTFAAVGGVFFGAILLARQFNRVISSARSSILLSRATAVIIAATSLWILAA